MQANVTMKFLFHCFRKKHDDICEYLNFADINVPMMMMMMMHLFIEMKIRCEKILNNNNNQHELKENPVRAFN
ncbi:CLUMA_CG019885, isoform A [Clunio marinus]|uniref:CLUMA_CG019885, isoform A n=1 Tax=Clunio marinus TaxID=568069 RepID=A0A1J1J207_9DIPT|nr:CLUMA_CG019885, isoform A [Clunio marinus]